MTAQLGGQEPPQEAVERALLHATPQTSHGQHCPVWTRRAEDPPPWDDCDCWIRDAAEVRAEAVTAALGLRVEDQWPVERRLLVEHNGHEHEYNHMCPACNPLEGEFELIRRRRYVGPWVEVTP